MSKTVVQQDFDDKDFKNQCQLALSNISQKTDVVGEALFKAIKM